MKLGAIVTAVRKAAVYFVDRRAFRLSAALSYYAILSIAPLLLVLLAVLGLVFDRAAIRGELIGQMRAFAGTAGGELAEGVLRQAAGPGRSIGAIVTGVLVLIWGASAVFAQLQEAMNLIWEVKPAPGRGVWRFVRQRIVSLGIVLALALLLLASLVVSAVLAGLNEYAGDRLPGTPALLEIAHALLSLVVFTLCFALLFKYVPHAIVAWRHVWLGAFVTALLFSGGQLLIAFYLRRSEIGTMYGAAGSVVAVLIWVYYSSLLVLTGAKFTHVMARRSGEKIQPTAQAVKTSPSAE